MILTAFSSFNKDKPIPLPPIHQRKMALHHWIQEIDFDGRPGEMVVLQWAPGAGNWCQSGMVGTNHYINTNGYRYVGAAIEPGTLELSDVPIAISGQSRIFKLQEIADDVDAAYSKGYQGRFAFCPETVEGLINCIKRLIGKD